MASGRTTVRALAAEVGLDLDEALVSLWEAGLTELEGPSDSIVGRQLPIAQRALGLATRSDYGRTEYWQRVLGLDEAQLEELLKSLQIRIAPRARRLPKGAVAKLKRHADLVTSPLVEPMEQTPPATSGLPPLTWTIVGHEGPIRFLSESEIESIHDCLAADFALSADPIAPAGVHDYNLLSSAAHRPQSASPKYPTVEMAVAALLHSLALNHCFRNGNKRTALVGLLVFLDENGMQLVCQEDELFRKVLLLAQHRLVPRHADDRPDRETYALARWICDNSRKLEKGERVLKWVRLRRILTKFGCTLEFSSGGGSKIKVSRVIIERGFLGRQRQRELSTNVYYGGEGTDVQKS